MCLSLSFSLSLSPPAPNSLANMTNHIGDKGEESRQIHSETEMWVEADHGKNMIYPAEVCAFALL